MRESSGRRAPAVRASPSRHARAAAGSTQLARRYARALYDVTSGPGAARDLQAELDAFARLLEGSDELRQALLHPTLTSDARGRLLTALADRSGASPLLRRLLGLVVAHDRVALLPLIAESFSDVLRAAEGRVAAEAVTAVPLAAAQKDALANALCSAVGKTVELETRTDPSILGGVLVRVGGRTLDGTVRTRLHALRERLASGR